MMDDRYPFKMHERVVKKIVDLHQEIATITENCDPKTIPRDVTDIEIALAKSEVIRKELLSSKSLFDNDDMEQREITKVIPRHKIEEQTQFKKRLLLMSASEIDTLPVCSETKALILGAQVDFIKAIRRLRFCRAYELYKYIRLWKSKT